eukprot:5374491-Pleurochrysis_carterae.AAC.1
METVASAKRKRETYDAVRHLAMSYTCVYHWSTIPEAVLYKTGFIHNFNEHRLNRVRAQLSKDFIHDDHHHV